ncbi:hypothetical protein [Nocardia brasiliensis]|uniref:hypothetical protein n=1 Tax=Nocardia brasiliensis TaxID=37326 RepID=UPI003D94507F
MYQWRITYHDDEHQIIPGATIFDALSGPDGEPVSYGEDITHVTVVTVTDALTTKYGDRWLPFLESSITLEHHSHDTRGPRTGATHLELTNTCTTTADGSPDPLGAANHRYLAQLWRNHRGISFAGYVTLRADAPAPARLCEIVDRLSTGDVLDDASLEHVCTTLGIARARITLPDHTL